MSDENLDEIKRLIDSMQSGLVELFDQLRELRRRLNITGVPIPSDTQASVVPLFTEVAKSPDTSPDDIVSKSSPLSPQIESLSDKEESDHIHFFSSSTSSLESSHRDTTPEPSTPFESTELVAELGQAESIPIGSAKVARVLDPIAHELRTGEAPASVLAEYLQSARDYLFGGDTSNERVERDMEVVLKFLRARSTKGIRPEERDNILKRINRWKEALAETH